METPTRGFHVSFFVVVEDTYILLPQQKKKMIFSAKYIDGFGHGNPLGRRQQAGEGQASQVLT